MKTKDQFKESPFVAEPSVIQFVDYQINGVYEIPLKLINKSEVSQKIKFLPPKTEFFSIRKVKLPSDEVSNIAPGMSVTIHIDFHAPSFADFEDVLTIVSKDN